MSETIILSMFSSIYDNIPVPRPMSWDDLVVLMASGHEVLENKSKAWVYSPAEWPSGSKRAKKAVIRVHVGVVDIDHVADADFMAMIEALDAAGLEYLYYSTYSHTGGSVSARVLVRFSRPVQAFEWPAVWSHLRDMSKGVIDPACKDCSRVYYGPSCPKESLPLAFRGHSRGAPLDVDRVLAQTQAVNGTLEEAGLFDRAQVGTLAARLMRSPSLAVQATGHKLQKAFRGKSFAQGGERNTSLYSMCCFLAEEWPTISAPALADVFRPSLQAMALEGDECPSVETAREMVERHQETVKARILEARAKARADQENTIGSVRSGGSVEPYTDDEMRSWAMDMGVASLDRFWILQRGSAYYLLQDGEYRGPYTMFDVALAARDVLTPSPVYPYKETRNGRVLMPAPELMAEYGTVITGIRPSLVAPRSRYNHATRTLIEAVCPHRVLVAERSPTVEGWLRALGGSWHDTLLDWIACVTDLTKPCAALYLEGEPGTGKTLLAEGLARIWSEGGATPLESMMGSFNSAVTSCPLVLADEKVPEDFMGAAKTGTLRQIIQSHNIQLRRKYLTDSTLEGSVRLILTANNQELLNSNEHLTREDIQAIVERIIHIKVNADAREYLQALSVEDRARMVQGDEIARHALWLVQTRKVTKGGRFMVQGMNEDLARTLTVNTGLRGPVCHWLVSYLLEPSKIETTNMGTEYVRRGPDGLQVTAQALGRHWDLYGTNTKAPGISRLAKALEGLSHGTIDLQVTIQHGNKTTATFHDIDPENLAVWAMSHGFADRDTILRLAREAPSSHQRYAGKRGVA